MKDNKFDRIVYSALREFSIHGYDKTSISAITKNADVSKGLLFYHFQSKKDLYIYLLKYIADVYTKEVVKNFDMKNTDFMKMLMDATKTKIKLMREYPYSLEFFLSVLKEEVKFKEIKDFLKQAQKINNYDIYAHILKTIDDSVFRDGIDVETALKVATWISEGYLKEGKFNNSDSIATNIDELEKLLKKLLYKDNPNIEGE